MTCKFEQCNSKVLAKELCNRHYIHLRKFGYVMTDAEVKAKYAKQKGVRLNTGRTHFKKNDAKLIGNKNRLGKPSWNKGTTGVMKAWNKGKKVPQMQNEKNHMWAGENVSYRALHRWVESHLGKSDTCEHCHESGLTGHRIHWSNISGQYKRNLSDWQRLCASCHGAYDSGKLTLAEIRG